MFYAVKIANKIGFKLTAFLSMTGFGGFIFIASFM